MPDVHTEKTNINNTTSGVKLHFSYIYCQSMSVVILTVGFRDIYADFLKLLFHYSTIRTINC